MDTRKRAGSLLLLPLAILAIGTLAERTFAPRSDPDGPLGSVVSLGDHLEANPERAALAALADRLTRDPNHPVRVVWRENIYPFGIRERYATYYPQKRRLSDVSMGQTTIQEDITLAGMRAALQTGDRAASFASARASSVLLLRPSRDTPSVAAGSPPDRTGKN